MPYPINQSLTSNFSFSCFSDLLSFGCSNHSVVGFSFFCCSDVLVFLWAPDSILSCPPGIEGFYRSPRFRRFEQFEGLREDTGLHFPVVRLSQRCPARVGKEQRPRGLNVPGYLFEDGQGYRGNPPRLYRSRQQTAGVGADRSDQHEKGTVHLPPGEYVEHLLP